MNPESTNQNYINRQLISSKSNGALSESELINTEKYVVVLAEPGAGKSELLKHLASLLEVNVQTAAAVNKGLPLESNSPLVIDAFDELANIEQGAIFSLLGKLVSVKPTSVIISSRSSEWDSSFNHKFKDYFGREPCIVRLQEFSEKEQQHIYCAHTQNNDFGAFQDQVRKADLTPLLANPQFLKMFADAYLESDGRLGNKSYVFEQSVARLAKEANEALCLNPLLSSSKRIDLASELFAKLLLSGVEGVSSNEVSENNTYPAITNLIKGNNSLKEVLATRLFKPGSHANHHLPVHKIISEYCAAKYFIQRINKPSDSLTLKQLLSIIAPNSVVRTELRGLIGWMACLGSEKVQKALIELDAYAVLANGEPSQLENTSKVLLLERLKEIEKEDPYFRREDVWRSINIGSNFFNKEMAQRIKPIIQWDSYSQLRELLIDLIYESKAVEFFPSEISAVVVNPKNSKHTRIKAQRMLLELNSFSHESNIEKLLNEASTGSLSVVEDNYESLKDDYIDLEKLQSFFNSCVKIYQHQQKRAIGERDFVKRMAQTLQVTEVEALLDHLTLGLSCICGEEERRCKCKKGVSKVVNHLLERYFTLVTTSFDYQRIWNWVNNLGFERRLSSKQSTAVKVLQDNMELRQSILRFVFSGLTDSEVIQSIRRNKFNGYRSHPGLQLYGQDSMFIAGMSFEENNTKLWGQFIPYHFYNRPQSEQGVDPLRRLMRSQANEKSEFMKVWSKRYREDKQEEGGMKRDRSRDLRSMRRYEKREAQSTLEDIEYIRNNLNMIENGEHFGFLEYFSSLLLTEPENIEKKCGDREVVRQALCNCLNSGYLTAPSLLELAEVHCESQVFRITKIIYASCLETLRTEGSLNKVPESFLSVVKIIESNNFEGTTEQERKRIKEEIDRRLFPNEKSKEDFLRQYIEPQFNIADCKRIDLTLLEYDDIFTSLRGKLSLEWLKKYSLHHNSHNILFDLVAKYGDVDELKNIILDHIPPLKTEDSFSLSSVLSEGQNFWLLRAFYFLEDNAAEYIFNILKADENLIFELDDSPGSVQNGGWPKLSAAKIEIVLNEFVEKWPEAYLSNTMGIGRNPKARAYQYLERLVQSTDDDLPENAIPVLERLLAGSRFKSFEKELKSILSDKRKELKLQNFQPPKPSEIVKFLDNKEIVTVELMRELVLECLNDYQEDISGGEFNKASLFYNKQKEDGQFIRKGEVESVNLVADYLKSTLQPKNFLSIKEHELKDRNRVDIIITKTFNGVRKMLVIEAKGQWNEGLETAITAQLDERYAHHPDTNRQGIYLVFWFGKEEQVLKRKNTKFSNGNELKVWLESKLTPDQKGRLDVFVLDVSRT